MSWLDRFFQGGIKNVAIAGTLLPQEVTLNFASGATGVDNPGLSRSDVFINVLATPTGTGFVHITGGVTDAAARAVNLSGADVTSTLGVVNGGTGAATLTAHAVLLGEGTSAVATVGPGASGLPLVGQGAADPIFAVLGVTGGGTGLSSVGSNGQVLTVVSGSPAWATNSANVTWANDLSGNGTTTAINQYISSISFSSAAAGGTVVINGTNTNFQWASGCTSPGWSQAGAGPSGGTATSITITPQGANATNGTPGGLILNLAAPTGTGTHSALFLQKASSQFLRMGPGGPNANYYSIWLGSGTGTTSNSADYALACQSSTLFVNAPSGNMQFTIAGGNTQFYIDNNGNNQLASQGVQSFGGGLGVVGVTNANTVPTSNPSGGGILYAQSGAGKWRGSSGTVTTFGPAEPHCPVCGSDFTTEHESEKYGYLAVCLKCLADELGDRLWIQRHKHFSALSGS